jgi:hypothetical protein
MADPICRWRNPSIETVCELVNSMPHIQLTKDEFREFMGKSIYGDGFFHTPYQLACQLGLYYESNDSKFIPRFHKDIDIEGAKDYLEHWIHCYYVPNPYTKRGFQNIDNPIYLVKSIVKYIETNPGSTNITDICNSIFKEETGNKDILINVLNNFSKVISIDRNGKTTLRPNYKNIINQCMDRNDKKLFFETIGKEISRKLAEKLTNLDKYTTYFAAIRTKPFLLLAGISGTGKSRLVRELAYMSCPKLGKLQEDPTTPGNFCMVEVKPNWHDSSELLGYTSGIKNTYIITPFVKFLVKAMRYPEVPFFVCLDEMNLAPVEQYFAEYLSVLETRKIETDSIISGSLINKDVFTNHQAVIFENLGLKSLERTDMQEEIVQIAAIENELKEFGLRLPQNVIVVGTVNMDDTTHQFSRKVIDRAMTIEMNELNFNNMFDDKEKLNYFDEPLDAHLFISDSVSANHALKLVDEDAEQLKAQTIEIMQALDEKLKDTPFRVAYRVQNELVIYFRNLRLINPQTPFDELFASAVDFMLKMKVLPRIEGDEDMVKKPLKALDVWTTEKGYTVSNPKIKEMLIRLDHAHYTSYWP